MINVFFMESERETEEIFEEISAWDSWTECVHSYNIDNKVIQFFIFSLHSLDGFYSNISSCVHTQMATFFRWSTKEKERERWNKK